MIVDMSDAFLRVRPGHGAHAGDGDFFPVETAVAMTAVVHFAKAAAC